MHIVGETRDGTHAELIAVPRDFRSSDPGRAVVRGGGGVSAHVRDRLPDARHARAASGRRVGARLGHRRRRRDRCARAGEGARRERRRHVVERRRSSRARRSSAPMRRVNHATGDVVAVVKEVTGGGAHVVVDDVGEATWKRTLDAARPEGRIVVCGATTGPNPPAALHRVWWKQLSILGSTMGTPGRLPGRVRPDRRGQGAAGRRQRVPAGRGGARRTSGSRPASSSARSCCGSRARRPRSPRCEAASGQARPSRHPRRG